jgi:hypothetical protein
MLKKTEIYMKDSVSNKEAVSDISVQLSLKQHLKLVEICSKKNEGKYMHLDISLALNTPC